MPTLQRPNAVMIFSTLLVVIDDPQSGVQGFGRLASRELLLDDRFHVIRKRSFVLADEAIKGGAVERCQSFVILLFFEQPIRIDLRAQREELLIERLETIDGLVLCTWFRSPRMYSLKLE